MAAAMVTLALTVLTAAPSGAGQSDPETHDDGTPVESEDASRYIVVLDETEDGLGTQGGPPAEVSEAVAEHAGEHGVRPTHRYAYALAGYAAELTEDQVAALRRDPRVAYVEEDSEGELDGQEVPTGVSRVFGPDNPNLGIGTGQDRRVDADIAVIDTGVNHHPDLNVVERLDCKSGTCAPGGFDDMGHGTHVAGSVAAKDNDLGVVGTAPGARIWSYRVCESGCSQAGAVAALDHITANAAEIEVATMSISFPSDSPALEQAYTTSIAAGVVHVTSAGNGDEDADGFYPNRDPDVLTVSNLNDVDGLPGGVGTAWCGSADDTLNPQSNWGAAVDLAAPGSCITSTARDGGYTAMSGTSMATPHVAGAVALLTSGGQGPADRDGVLAVRDTILAAGNHDWTWESRGEGDYHEPLLGIGDSAVFAPTLVTGEDETWSGASPVPGGTYRFAAATCPGDPFGYNKVGGGDAGAWRYDLQTDAWDQLAPFPGTTAGGLAAACTFDGELHVVGGASTGHHVYDIATDTWSEAAPLPRDVYRPAIGAWAGEIHVIGGSEDFLGAPSDQVDVYDVATDTWSEAAAPQPLADMGFAQSASYLYLTGGWTAASPGSNETATFRYDMATRQWASGPPLDSARYGHKLVATDQALYAIGGFSEDPVRLYPTELVERIELDGGGMPTGTWAELDPLPLPVGWLGGACLDARGSAVIAGAGGLALGRADPAARDEHWQMVAYGERCADGDWGHWGPAAAIDLQFPSADEFAEAQCPGDPDGYYVIGGRHAEGGSNRRAWRYDAASDTWGSIAGHPGDSLSSVDATAVCTPDGKIHVFGGRTTTAEASTFHRVYDTDTDSWSTAEPLPAGIGVHSAAAGFWDGRIYVVGGFRSGKFDARPSEGVLVYDTTTGVWALRFMPRAVGAAGYAQVGSHLYVVGGSATLRFDMATETWTEGPALPSPRSHVGMLATDQSLYAVGGGPSYAPTAAVDRLDLTTWPAGEWTAFHPLRATRHNPGTACWATGDGAAFSAVGGWRDDPALGHTVRTTEHARATVPGETCGHLAP